MFKEFTKIAWYVCKHVFVYTFTGGLYLIQRLSDLVIFLGVLVRESIDSVCVTYMSGEENDLNKSDYTWEKCVRLTKSILNGVDNSPKSTEEQKYEIVCVRN